MNISDNKKLKLLQHFFIISVLLVFTIKESIFTTAYKEGRFDRIKWTVTY